MNQVLDTEDMMATLRDVSAFAETPAFQALLQELKDTPRPQRPDFVKSFVLQKGALEKRGIQVPEDMIIQRSKFADARPTLFCVTKYLKDGKRKITITYDDALNPTPS